MPVLRTMQTCKAKSKMSASDTPFEIGIFFNTHLDYPLYDFVKIQLSPFLGGIHFTSYGTKAYIQYMAMTIIACLGGN